MLSERIAGCSNKPKKTVQKKKDSSSGINPRSFSLYDPQRDG
jgi:hypothetical protein